MAPRIQHISIPAGGAIRINCDIDPDDGVSLFDAQDIQWKMYEQAFGVPLVGVDPVLIKVLDNGIEIEDSDLLKFFIDLENEDTVNLLRNYYHEAHVFTVDSLRVPVVYGIATVTATENR